jgi:hypothetical protein
MAQLDLNNGLVAWYPFNGNAQDESSYHNNGSVDGATLINDRFGHANSAYYFDGVNDRITVPNNDMIDFDNDESFTIALWMKTTNASEGCPLNKQYAGYWNGYCFCLNNSDAGYCTQAGHIMFYAAAGGDEDACSNNTVNTGEWVFVTSIYNRTENSVKLYINADLQSDIGRISGNIKTTQNLQIGYGPTTYNNEGYFYYQGALDDIRFYSRILSQEEIDALYSEGNANPDTCLLAWYPFNGNAHDESGNGKDGIVHGANLTTDRFGRANSAYSFNGTDNYISLSGTEAKNLFSGFSLVAWVKFTTSNGSSIVSKHINYYPNGFCMSACNNNANLTTNNNMYYLATTETYDDDIWHMFTGVFDGSRLFIYVDGNLKASGEAEYTIGNDINIRIGADSELSFFKGKIDDVRIYECVLDSASIVGLYHEGLCVETITVTDTLIIQTQITNFNPVTFLNTIKIYPNPTNDHITIDYGSYTDMEGYTIKITDSAGQVVFENEIDEQQSYIDLSSWIGKGMYFVFLYDKENRIVDIKKIALI